MAQPLRLAFAVAIYHLTSRGNAQQKVFFMDTDRRLLSFFSSRCLADYRSTFCGVCVRFKSKNR